MARKLYLYITTKPLYRAIEEKLPAVETLVDLEDTSGMELTRILRESQRKLNGGEHENR